LAKLLVTLIFMLAVISRGRYELAALLPLLFYPLVLAAWAGAPQALLLRRFAVALPFCLAAGIANIVVETEPAFRLGQIMVSYGTLSCLTLVLKCYLTVTALLLLVAVTPLAELGRCLLRLHAPPLFVDLLLLTYRYLGALLGEASTVYLAYRLRAPGAKGVALRDMGSLAGNLLLRSFDRAERVYQAMLCRGYGAGGSLHAKGRPWHWRDSLYLLLAGGGVLLLRLADWTWLLKL